MSDESIRDLHHLIEAMDPVLNEGIYAYAIADSWSSAIALGPVVLVRESEGITVIVEEEQAQAAGLRILFRAAWITLKVHSDLDAVGLTAAFSNALASGGISCNVIAGAHHDHIFVPASRSLDALALLKAMQRRALASC